MRTHLHTIATAAALAAGSAMGPSAQEEAMHAPKFTVPTYSGASIPTGTLRDSFDNDKSFSDDRPSNVPASLAGRS